MKRKTNKKAFTLVELMAVLIILGLLATVAVTHVIGRIREAQKTTTMANLKILRNAVIHFRMNTGRLPTEEEGLYALLEQPADVEDWPEGGFLEESDIPKDGWKHDFIFELNPESGKPFVIRSAGPDGEEYTEDDMLSTDAS